MSTDVATQVNAPVVFTDGILANISSYADALAKFEAAGVSMESIEDYGTGFHVVPKSALVGKPMLLVEWRFNPSELNENGFVSVMAVCTDGAKVIFNDGSTGILEQLLMVTAQRVESGAPTPQAGLGAPNGLTKSDYTYTDEKGKKTPASTYYIGE